MYYDQLGTPHATETLAILANVWDYDQVAMYEDARYDDTPSAVGVSQRLPEAVTGTGAVETLAPGCYRPDHICDACSPF